MSADRNDLPIFVPTSVGLVAIAAAVGLVVLLAAVSA